ncbi:MAG: MMPL family transporter, partial [Lentisphaeraceae bacterium]|nr:MMPL family transporter [Lentisphaeraceae bacterium]
MEQKFFNKYTSFILKWRWLIILVTLAAALFCMSGFKYLSFNGQYRIFFSKDNPKLQAFDELQNTYTKDDNILFVVVPKNGDIFTEENLKIVKELTEATWQIPYSTRVDSLSNFQWTRSHKDEDGEDGLLVTDLVEDSNKLTPELIKSIKKVALHEPAIVNRLVSPKGHVCGVNVRIELPGFGVGAQKTSRDIQLSSGKNIVEFRWKGLSLVPESLEAVFPKGVKILSEKADMKEQLMTWEVDAKTEFKGQYTVKFTGLEENSEAVRKAVEIEKVFEAKYPDIQIKLTGMSMMNEAFNSSIADDLSTLNPLMYLTILVVTALLLKSFTATLATMLVIAISTLTSLGIFFLLGNEMTGPSSSAPTMILTLAVADCIHILVLYVNNRKNGVEKYDAMLESLRVNFGAVFLTSFTTAIGFLCMNFSDAPPYNDLGNITAIGIGIAFLLSVTFLPALIFILPSGKKEPKASKNQPFMNSLAEFVISHRPTIFIFFTLFTAAMAYCITKNDLNDQFVNYFSKNVKFRNDTDFAMENLSGIYQIEFNLYSGEDQGITSPEYLKKLDEFKNYLLTVEDVIHISSVSDIFKKINRSMHNDNSDFYKIPDNRELAAQYLLLYEFSLPQGFDLNNQINTARSSTRFTVTLNNVATKRLKVITAQAENWLKQNAPQHMQTHAASPAIMFAHISDSNINSMLFGTLWAMLIISFCLAIALKSVSFGIMSLVPNFIPAILAFGFWGIINGQIGLGLSVVVCMTLGIVVDDTVHFLSKYM